MKILERLREIVFEIMILVILIGLRLTDSLNSPLHGVLLFFLAFSGNLFPLHYPCLNYEENSHDVHEDHPHKCQSKRPGEIVLFPVGHEISSISFSTEDDESNCSTYTCYYEVKADPSEDLDPVIIINAEEIHKNKADGDEHPHEADSEEKLGGDKEWFDEFGPDDVVLLQQDMSAPVELHLILVTLVVEAIEACVP